MARCDHFGGQAQLFEQLDLVIADIDFPPSMLDAGGRGIFVMVVVPTFANGEQGHQPIVAAVFACFVISVPKHMTEGIDRPSDVPYGDDTQVYAPDDHAQGDLHRAGLSPADPTDQVTGDKEDWQLRQTDV